ncbi:MAG: AMP-binding protein [Solirubrobacteraceae bacterium]
MAVLEPMGTGDLLARLERAAELGGTLNVVGRHGPPERITFAELWETSGGVAAAVREIADPPATVGAVLSTSVGCARTIVGTLRAGLRLASLPTRARAMSAEQHAVQLRALCAAASAVALTADAATLAALGSLGLPLVDCDELGHGRAGSETTPGGRLVQFTSGSTSDPKGIVLGLDRIGLHAATIGSRLGIEAGDAVCAWLPLSHDMGLIGAFLSSWVAGADLTLIDPQVFVLDPGTWMQTCAETRAALTWGPNFGYALAARAARHLGDASLAALRVCVVGAEPVKAETLRAFASATARLGFDERALTPGYGMAEATLAISSKPVGELWRSARVDSAALGEGEWRLDPDGAEVVSVGVPLAGVEVRVTDADRTVSEIQVRSPSLLEEYVGAELALVDDGWFATGDLGAIVDGQLYVTGRTDDLLIVGGRNLYARDLELVAGEHAAVREGMCVAAQRPDGRYVIVAEPRLGTDRAQLRDAVRWIQDELTVRFGAAPAEIAIIAPRTLPKTASGKLARRATARLYDAGELERVV